MKYRIISILLIIASLFSICPVCFADEGGCLTISSTHNKGSVTLADPVCLCGDVVVSGVHSKGKGQLVTLLVTDQTKSQIYAIGETESLANGKFYFDFGLNTEAYGKNLVAYIDGNDGGKQSTCSFVYNCQCGTNRNALTQIIPEIEGLISECEARKISVEYEKVNLGVIKKFEGFLDGYFQNGLYAEYEHNFNVIWNLANESKTNLNEYINGTKTAKVAPVYVSSKVTEDGQSLLADVSINGEIVNQPTFFNGYGHWSDAISDYETFADMGANYTHYEIGPNSILKPGTEGRKYDINTAGVNKVKEVFALAEENNVSIMFMTSMHYFPEFIYETYSEINNNGNGEFPDFMPYNPTHPEVMAALEAFLNAIIPEIKDYKSFHSICLANEPLFISYEYPDYYLAAYRNFLKEKYNNNVSALRDAYGILYSLATFDNITMPERAANSAHFNDWREFNDTILTQWFTELNKIVKKVDENIPVQTKVSAYISSAGDGSRRVFCGTNYEQWSQVMDLNGCDAWGVYGNANKTIQGKTMWYDFMTSLKDAPVINSEDHILSDSSTLTYNENELKFNMADMWQGAIHGRAGSVYWLWDKSSRAGEGTSYYNANLTRRADHVAAIGKINLDLNRLANEITAIQKKDARCAVLYSNYTQVSQSDKHLAAMYQAYKYLQNNGEKVYIVNDTYPEKLNENNNLELLIVPYGQYMPENVWKEIEKFIISGKKVIFAEQGSASYYNENGKDLNSALKANVLEHSERVQLGTWNSIEKTFSSSAAMQTAIDNVISGFNSEVKVISENGETEWTAARYGNGYVVNLCNFGSEATQISISCDSTEKLFDLTNNEKIASSFVLQPYETKLVRLDDIKEGITFWNPDGSEADKVSAGTIAAKANTNLAANSSFIHILAVYTKDMMFERVVSEEGSADENGRVFSKVEIEISEEEKDNCVLKSFLFDGISTLKPYIPAELLGQN